MKKKPMVIGITLAAIVAIALVTIGVMTAVVENKTQKMQDDISSVYTDEKYKEAVWVDNVEVITQEVSCGYAVIEMFSAWDGGSITEESLYEQYGKVVTSTGKSFCEEMNKQFPQYKTTMHSYLSDTELIDKVYDSLAKGVPVPFEWAAKYEDAWTLHYSLIIGMDVPNDKITVANPYGYIEELSLEDFLERTSFEAYENMPFYFKLGFAFGLFEKNTVYIVK